MKPPFDSAQDRQGKLNGLPKLIGYNDIKGDLHCHSSWDGGANSIEQMAKEAGVKMVINTDSHRKDQLNYMELGIAQARRGWATAEDVINTRPLKNLLGFFKRVNL